MRRLLAIIAGSLLLAACGAVVPATQSPQPLGIIVSSPNQSSAAPASGAPLPESTPQPVPSASKPPFVPTPYSPPGPPSTLSSAQAQATRTALESQIAAADQKLRTVSFTPQPTPIR